MVYICEAFRRASVDFAWEQKKLETGKLFENVADSHKLGARIVERR